MRNEKAGGSEEPRRSLTIDDKEPCAASAIKVKVTCDVPASTCQALPDSDIFAASLDFLGVVKKRKNDRANLDVCPKAANNQWMKPVGSVTINQVDKV